MGTPTFSFDEGGKAMIWLRGKKIRKKIRKRGWWILRGNEVSPSCNYNLLSRKALSLGTTFGEQFSLLKQSCPITPETK